MPLAHSLVLALLGVAVCDGAPHESDKAFFDFVTATRAPRGWGRTAAVSAPDDSRSTEPCGDDTDLAVAKLTRAAQEIYDNPTL